MKHEVRSPIIHFIYETYRVLDEVDALMADPEVGSVIAVPWGVAHMHLGCW